MRRVRVGACLVLCVFVLVPAAGAGVRKPAVTVAVFYYPWYGTPARDGAYQHWNQNGHQPPGDIASSFYPARGAYSSSDPAVIDAHMREIARAGIDEIVFSWWGRGSPEDGRLPAVIDAARSHGLQVAAHLEPYGGRTIATTTADIAYLRTLGIRDFFVYHATDYSAGAWKELISPLKQLRFFAQTPLAGFAARGGFTGIYTYDIYTYRGQMFARICSQAHRRHLLCAPSVGPGYTARRATGDTRFVNRRNGATYDGMWRALLGAHADVVTITSYNEWHEGTQIEPARARPGYASYDGAWGRHGRAAETAYLVRTAHWTKRLTAR
jgi:hypothetical protein